MTKILVEKPYRLRNILGKTKYEEDLLENKNIKIKKFLNEYKEYFETTNMDKLKEFYDKTGIILTHIYTCGLNEVYQNMYGCWLKESNKKIFNHDLLIIEEVDKMFSNKNKAVVKEKELKLQDINFEYGNNIRSFISNENTLEGKINYIKTIFDISYVDESRIKELMFDPLNNLLILLDSGDLYSGNKLIETNVEYIFEECSTHYLIIYKNNKIESYTSKYINMCSYDNDKILYGSNYLISLHNKIARLTLLIDFEFNTVVYSTFENVDDIMMEDDEYLILVKGKEKIKVPIYSYYVLEN